MSGCPLKRAKVHQQADEKPLKKEGRDTKGRMGGGDKKQERKTGAIVMWLVPARHMHRALTVIFKCLMTVLH